MVFDRVGIQFKGYSMANKQSSGLYSGIFPFNYNRASRDHFLCVSNKINNMKMGIVLPAKHYL